MTMMGAAEFSGSGSFAFAAGFHFLKCGPYFGWNAPPGEFDRQNRRGAADESRNGDSQTTVEMSLGFVGLGHVRLPEGRKIRSTAGCRETSRPAPPLPCGRFLPAARPACPW